jgi:hypothetical protein
MHGAHHHFWKRWWVRFDSAQLRVNGGRERGIKVATCFILILICCFGAVVGMFVEFSDCRYRRWRLFERLTSRSANRTANGYCSNSARSWRLRWNASPTLGPPSLIVSSGRGSSSAAVRPATRFCEMRRSGFCYVLKKGMWTKALSRDKTMSSPTRDIG